MKIVLASFLFEPEIGGGAAAVASQLADSLSREAHEVAVLTSWAGTQVVIEQISRLKVIRLPAHNLYWVAEKDRQPIHKRILWQLIDTWNPLIYRLARQVILTEAPDVVHSHKLRGLSPSIWSAAASVGVRKLVHTCHDFELLSPEGLLQGLVGKLARDENLLVRPYQAIRKRFTGLVDFATAPSQFVLELHRKMGFFARSRTMIVPNSHGLNANELKQRYAWSSKLPKGNSPKRFLFIGRMEKAKGVDLLCQAFLEVAKKDRDLRLRIVGHGTLDSSLREKYRNQKNIEFRGAVFGPQKNELFEDSDVLVAPSVVPESFGIVIAEAFSHGLPVIAARVGAYPEIVTDGQTGLLVNPGSVADISRAMSIMIGNRRLVNEMARNCIEAAQRFTLEKFYGNYLRIYEANP